MKIRTSIGLSILAAGACLMQSLAVNAEGFRLTRPSDHMQQGGVEVQDDATTNPVPGGLNGQMQTASMDNTNLRAGAMQNGLRGGAMDNGANNKMNVPLSASTDLSNPIKKFEHFLKGGSRQLGPNELANLGHHDIVLLIDKSSSMAEVDCPSMENRSWMISRWNWCREQTIDLAQQTASVLPQGISVLLFSWTTRIFPHVDMRAIPQIFADNHPDGITNEANALGAVLDDYFQRRDSAHGKVSPLLVAIVTDGRPTSESAVRNKIIEATHSMRSPDEIKLTFLLIGQDSKGIQFIQEMDHGLVSEGAKFDIVSCKPFPELVRSGLASAMVDCISESQRPSLLDALNNGKHKKH